MEKDKEKTKVIFRQWANGRVVAMFPEIAADTRGWYCQSYMHVGQHGAANPDLVRNTKPANFDDDAVKDLIKELETLGYNLEIIKRFRYSHQQTRQETYK
jgi:hypothetical protein